MKIGAPILKRLNALKQVIVKSWAQLGCLQLYTSSTWDGSVMASLSRRLFW